MKRSLIILTILVISLGMIMASAPVQAVTNKVILKIAGMTWGAWPLVIRKALEGLEGVEKASINFRRKRGDVLYDPDKVTQKEIVDRVNQIGFKAKVIENWPRGGYCKNRGVYSEWISPH